eukprot:TRINITY_DN16063_c0_g1_i1.p1 TRINITY_DN16063_c0_g1~~TRINITY_DN16063_c0_g1_i1.p1  ORF type:complete len:260 (-),score=57.71 TRINITY_DN16063_c0_g1_i1:145-924(-)
MKGKFLLDPNVRIPQPHHINNESEDSDDSHIDTFQFFKSKEIDWRMVKRLNLKELKQDDQALTNLASNLITASITTEEIKNTKPKNISKLFQVYQLIISRLLIAKETSKPELEEEERHYECRICRGKKFVSEKYLQAHYTRRHPDYKENGRLEKSIADLYSQRANADLSLQSVDESLNFRDSLDFVRACPSELRESVFSKKGEARAEEIKDMLSNITSKIVERTSPGVAVFPLNKPLLVLNPHSTNREHVIGLPGTLSI